MCSCPYSLLLHCKSPVCAVLCPLGFHWNHWICDGSASHSVLPCHQNQECNLQPHVWGTGDVGWVNSRPKTFEILYTCICLLWVGQVGNLALEEGFMQPVLQGILLPFLHTCRYQRFQSPSQPLSLGSPARHWEVLWDFRPEPFDFFQSTKDQKSSEVSWAIDIQMWLSAF